MTCRIVIIGCGQIGRRHLQSLYQQTQPLEVSVVDSSADSLTRAQKLIETMPQVQQVTLKYSSEISEVKGPIDVAIVATSSTMRQAVITQLLEHCEVQYLILEKLVFCNNATFFEMQEIITERTQGVWVNCCRRMYPFYQWLRDQLKGSSRLNFRVEGSNWGLGSSAIHYLDLFSYLSGQMDIQLSADRIDTEMKMSKRQGFVELTGILMGNTPQGSFLSIQSYAEGNAPIVLHISNESFSWMINETTQKACLMNAENKWQPSWCDVKSPYQSELTSVAVKSILEEGHCDLPTYKESMRLHLPLLTAFEAMMLKNHNKSLLECPVT